jgi:hypothetical protein
MPVKRWQVDWKGHRIEVENTWFSGARLFIDGKEVAKNRDLVALSAHLRGEIVHEDGRTSRVVAEIEAILTVKCTIAVDDTVLIERDVHLTPLEGRRSAGPWQPPRHANSAADTGLNMEVAPCFACGTRSASKVGFTLWGGILGPRMLNHVRCDGCGATYNSKTGRSNRTAIVIYVGVLYASMIALAAVLLLRG